MLHRTAGFIFDLGIFTNLSADHIGPNEHKDFEDYLHCKSKLFRQCRTGIFNGDDPGLKGSLKDIPARSRPSAWAQTMIFALRISS